MGLVYWTRHHSEQRATPMSDHARGCEGRNYTCTCGHDAASTALVERLTKALADMLPPDLPWKRDADGVLIHHKVAAINAARSALASVRGQE